MSLNDDDLMTFRVGDLKEMVAEFVAVTSMLAGVQAGALNMTNDEVLRFAREHRGDAATLATAETLIEGWVGERKAEAS